MAKIVQTTVDNKGNVTTDFSGFVGDECVAEENRLRQALAGYGLVLNTTKTVRKCADSRPAAQHSTRSKLPT